MRNYHYPCKFCGQENRIQMYISKCETCHVEFMTVERANEWVLVSLTYRFDDPVFYVMVMQLETEYTTIYLGPPQIIMDNDGNGELSRQRSIPEVWPDTRPQEALHLARRLINMMVFS